MSDPTKTFMSGLMDGDYLLEEIDDFVDAWHDDGAEAAELHEFLGMTWEEYSLWVLSPESISDIASARKRGVSLTLAVNDNLKDRMKLAARSDKASKIAVLQRWIEAQNDGNSRH